MKISRRVMLSLALLLVLVVAAGFGWYRWSDTGKGWRYQDKLAGYCDGLIPYQESAALTDLDVASLSFDEPLDGDLGFNDCKVADVSLTIAQIPGDAVNPRTDDVFDEIAKDSGGLPMPIDGGWRGYTNLIDTGIVLTCANQPASVVVAARSEREHGPGRAGKVAELVAATAVRAVDHFGCKTDLGGRIPPLTAPPEEELPTSATDGTCAGVLPRDAIEANGIHWMQQTKATGTAPLEECVLGEKRARSETLYRLYAHFGPYAQMLRSTDRTAWAHNGDSGVDDSRDRAWATAQCPGYTARALFRIEATEYADLSTNFLRPTLRAFAERSAKQHGCTDLKLPN